MQQLRRWLRHEDGISDETTRRALAAYYGLITFTDANIGRMLDVIDGSSLKENTVVIYTSDHGESAGHHDLWQKFCFYEPAARVPLIVRYPGAPSGVRSTYDVSLVDLAPTLYEIAGIEPPKGLAGESLLAAVTGENGDAGRGNDLANRPVFAEYHAHGIIGSSYMIKKGGVKYIYYPGYEAQLFDLARDPDETVNLVNDPAYADVKAEFHSRLLEIVEPDELAAWVKEYETLSGLQAVNRFPYGESLSSGEVWRIV